MHLKNTPKKKVSQNAGVNQHCNFSEIDTHRDIVIIKIFSHSLSTSYIVQEFI